MHHPSSSNSSASLQGLKSGLHELQALACGCNVSTISSTRKLYCVQGRACQPKQQACISSMCAATSRTMQVVALERETPLTCCISLHSDNCSHARCPTMRCSSCTCLHSAQHLQNDFSSCTWLKFARSAFPTLTPISLFPAGKELVPAGNDNDGLCCHARMHQASSATGNTTGANWTLPSTPLAPPQKRTAATPSVACWGPIALLRW